MSNSDAPLSALRRAFSTDALRRLHSQQLSPAEWDMVLQQRIDAIVQNHARILHDKDAQIAALEKELTHLKYGQLAKAQGPVFLLDGSASMVSLQTALPTVLTAASKKTDAALVMWGSSHPAVIDLKNKDTVRVAQAGLNSGSDLSPTLRMLSQVGGQQQLVIVSDGDIFDGNACKQLLENMLATANITLDAVIIKSRPEQTQMERFLSGLKIGGNARAPRIVTCTAEMAEIEKALTRVTRKQAAPKKHPQP